MEIRISLFALGQRETGKPRKRRQKGRREAQRRTPKTDNLKKKVACQDEETENRKRGSDFSDLEKLNLETSIGSLDADS